MTLVSHADFIIAAYGSAAVILGLLILWVAVDYRSLQRTLADFDDAGVTRRSEQTARSSS
jgi:heme exporter protein CcmD